MITKIIFVRIGHITSKKLMKEKKMKKWIDMVFIIYN